MADFFYSSIYGDLTQLVQLRFDEASKLHKQLFDQVIFEKYLDWDTPTTGLDFEEAIGQYGVTVAAATIGLDAKEPIIGYEGLKTMKERVLHHALTKPMTIQDYRKILTLLDSKPIELATNCSQVDSAKNAHTTKVAIPIEQKMYTDNYYYKAYVSGYKPQLDSIEVFRDTEYIYIDPPEQKPKRFGIGIQAGYGVAFTKQPTYAPYIGVGISYNLIRF